MKRNLPPATLIVAHAPRGGPARSTIRLLEPSARPGLPLQVSRRAFCFLRRQSQDGDSRGRARQARASWIATPAANTLVGGASLFRPSGERPAIWSAHDSVGVRAEFVHESVDDERLRLGRRPVAADGQCSQRVRRGDREGDIGDFVGC